MSNDLTNTVTVYQAQRASMQRLPFTVSSPRGKWLASCPSHHLLNTPDPGHIALAYACAKHPKRLTVCADQPALSAEP